MASGRIADKGFFWNIVAKAPDFLVEYKDDRIVIEVGGKVQRLRGLPINVQR